MTTSESNSALADSASTWFALNINQYVRVKLTDRGRETHRQNFEKLLKVYPLLQYPYQPPVEDEEGWSRWELWQLMAEFGSHMNMGGPLLFEATIELQVEAETKDCVQTEKSDKAEPSLMSLVGLFKDTPIKYDCPLCNDWGCDQCDAQQVS